MWERHIDWLPPAQDRACSRGMGPGPESNPGPFSPGADTRSMSQTSEGNDTAFSAIVQKGQGRPQVPEARKPTASLWDLTIHRSRLPSLRRGSCSRPSCRAALRGCAHSSATPPHAPGRPWTPPDATRSVTREGKSGLGNSATSLPITGPSSLPQTS